MVKSRALQIDGQLQILAELQTLRVSDRAEALFFQLCDCVTIFPKIRLGANQHNGGIGAMMCDFGIPLKIKDDRKTMRNIVVGNKGRWVNYGVK